MSSAMLSFGQIHENLNSQAIFLTKLLNRLFVISLWLNDVETRESVMKFGLRSILLAIFPV